MPPTAPQCGLTFEKAVAPHRRVDCALGGKDLRPLTWQDLEKLVDDLPMRGEVLRDEIGEPRKVRAFGRHGVEKPREARGECRSLPRQ